MGNTELNLGTIESNGETFEITSREDQTHEVEPRKLNRHERRKLLAMLRRKKKPRKRRG